MTPVLLALFEDALKYNVLKIKSPAKIQIVDSNIYPYDISQHMKPEQSSRIVVKESKDGIEFSLRLALLFIFYLSSFILSGALTLLKFLPSHKRSSATHINI